MTKNFESEQTPNSTLWLDIPLALMAVALLFGLLRVVGLLSAGFGTTEISTLLFLGAAASAFILWRRWREVARWEKATRLRNQSFKALYEVPRAINQQQTVYDVARAAVDSIAKWTDWEAVTILLLDDTATRLVVKAATGQVAKLEGKAFPSEQGIIGRAFIMAQTQVEHGLNQAADHLDRQAAFHLSCLALPLKRGELTIGVLTVHSDRPDAFNHNEILLGETLADSIAVGLDNASNQAEMWQHATGLNSLYNVHRLVNRPQVTLTNLSEALYLTVITLGFNAGILSIADPVTGELTETVTQGFRPIMLARLKADGLDGTLCNYVYIKHRPILVSDTAEENELNAELRKTVPLAFRNMKASRLQAFMGEPLRHGDKVLGTLCLFANQPRKLSRDEVALFTSIGQQFATALAHVALFKETNATNNRLKALIHAINDGVLLFTHEAQLLYINKTAVDMLDLPNGPSDWIMQQAADIIETISSYAADLVEAIIPTLNNKLSDSVHGRGDITLLGRTIEWSSLPVLSDNTNIGRLIILRDVTEKRDMDRLRDGIFQMAVHDLRDPLAGIAAALEMVENSQNQPARLQEFLALARSNANTMSEFINTVLDVSRLESKSQPIRTTAINLFALVERCIGRQAKRAEVKHIEITNNISPRFPLVQADATLLERVIYNLIDNALRYTPESGRVILSASQQSAESILVTVQDNGQLIPEPLWESAFDKFAVNGQTERGGGVSLAFCKEALEAHHEIIWVEGGPEKGMSFKFTLTPAATLDS